jgi:hypothetical protein
MIEKLYFTIYELCHSDIADKKGINNNPRTMEQIHNLWCLHHYVLRPLRLKLNKAVHINSSYRCPEVNKLVGGVSNSQHLTGQAADIHVKGVTAKTLWEYIKSSDIVYDQLILENGWVHVSYNPKHNRMQAFMS